VCETSQLIYPTENKNIEITFDILDMNINAGLTGFAINLCISEPVEVDPTTGVVTNQTNSKYSNASYNIDTTAGTAKISRSSDNISGELVLMDKVYVGGQEYVVTEIADEAFKECLGLIGEITIPNTITKIGEAAFTNCNKITGSLTIPDSVTQLGHHAFSSCRGFSGTLVLSKKLTRIEHSTFVGCNGLVGTLIIPKGITKIGDAAFSGCDGFTSVEVEQGNPTYYSKQNCIISKQGDILVQYFACGTIPSDSNISIIANYAISHILKIDWRIDLPEGIEEIQYRAFSQNLALTNIKIPSTITIIAEEAFIGTKNLVSVTIESSVPPTVGANVFNGNGTVVIYVPSGSVQAYKTASGWSEYADRIFAMS
ncbi:MAG: leucine-rich repeat domain-containing protein, partial [Clostridia bacterium]|nr:leucine-rich repeat domain-containing protein [Clostridia bacterium]